MVQTELYFSSTELEIGGGLPRRSVELLKKEEVISAPIIGAKRGGTPRWDFDTLEAIGIAGGIFKVVPSLILSVRLANVIVEEIKSSRNKPIARFEEIYFGELSSLLKPEDLQLTGDEKHIMLHARLREKNSIYRRNQADLGDIVILIADNKFVFLTTPRALPWAGFSTREKIPAVPAYIIDGWQRGLSAYVRFIPFQETLSDSWRLTGQATPADKAAETAALQSLHNATAVFAINISLCARQCIDRVYDLREGK